MPSRPPPTPTLDDRTISALVGAAKERYAGGDGARPYVAAGLVTYTVAQDGTVVYSRGEVGLGRVGLSDDVLVGSNLFTDWPESPTVAHVRAVLRGAERATWRNLSEHTGTWWVSSCIPEVVGGERCARVVTHEEWGDDDGG